MNTISKNSRFLIVVLLLLSASQLVFAQDSAGTPQWMIDRQQYEPSYAPVAQPLVVVSQTPQWVIDRQQYEPSYAPVAQSLIVASQTPQWVIDRQQYEPTYVHPSGDFPATTVVLNDAGS